VSVKPNHQDLSLVEDLVNAFELKRCTQVMGPDDVTSGSRGSVRQKVHPIIVAFQLRGQAHHRSVIHGGGSQCIGVNFADSEFGQDLLGQY
jgi:hypothetical protein